jgi:hypothetical protein
VAKKVQDVASGGTYYRIGGKVWLVYTIHGGTKRVAADVVYKGLDPDKVNLEGMRDGGELTRSEFNRRVGSYVEGGDPSEVYEIEGDYEEWFKNELLRASGYNRPALENDEVFDVLVEGLLGGWSGEEIAATLENTKWYQTRTNQTRKWDNMTDTQRSVEISGFAGNLQDVYHSVFGKYKSIDSPWINRLATNVAQGKLTYEAAVNRMRMAGVEKGTGVEEKQRRADVAQTMLDLENQARRWGIRMNEKNLRSWAAGIVDGKKGKEINMFIGHLKNQAEMRYGSAKKGNSERDRDTATAEWADPYAETLREVLELGTGDADDLIFDRRVQTALRQGQDLNEFQNRLRHSEEWKHTSNYREATRGTLSQLGRMMGFG